MIILVKFKKKDTTVNTKKVSIPQDEGYGLTGQEVLNDSEKWLKKQVTKRPKAGATIAPYIRKVRSAMKYTK